MLVDSGRSSLKLSLMLLPRKSGRIAFPAYTCPILFEVILDAGYEPVPVDVDYQTIEMDPSQLRKEIINGLDGIIVVHLFGDPSPLLRVKEISRDTPLVEDCAQGIGGVCDSKPVGSQGNASIFSFGFGKTITGGMGGALSLNSDPFRWEDRGLGLGVQDPRVGDRIRALFWMAGLKFGSLSPLYSIAYPFFRSRQRNEDREEIERINNGHHLSLSPRLIPSCVSGVIESQLKKIRFNRGWTQKKCSNND